MDSIVYVWFNNNNNNNNGMCGCVCVFLCMLIYSQDQLALIKTWQTYTIN